jgi:CIC family chloride channel protein
VSGKIPGKRRRSWVERRAAGIRAPVARSIRLLGLSAVVGVVAGLAAAGLDAALEFGSEQLVGRFASPGGPEILDLDWQILLLPALGGLVSGLIVLPLGRAARGHGTDQLVHSFHHRDGCLDLRGPLIKAGAAVGVISCGGSAGPEGPIASLGAAIGSSVARYLRMTPRERRVLLLAGCAGGVGAIFGCPLGGALFATSILYQEPEFESESLVPAFVASVVSYSTFMAFDRYGTHLLRDADALVFQSPAELPVYVLLGVACGLVAILFSTAVSAVEGGFERLHQVPVWLRPALGGMLTGLVAIALPQVMDPQYRFVQNALDGSLFADPDFNAGWLAWAALFGLVAVGKCIATAFTVGSGGAGGLLGPSVFIGGMTGAFVGAALEGAVPGIMPDSLRQALIPVGMAGVLSAAMRVPIASMVMVIEMTGSYGLVVPLMLVTTTAYLVGRRRGLIQDQVPSSAQSPAHAGDSIVHLLEAYLVEDVMEPNWPFLATTTTPLAELVERLPSGTRPHFAILDGHRLVGVISISDILHLASEPGSDTTVARDIMTRDLITLEPRRTLYEALRIFGTENVSVLPVITDGRRDGTGHFVGMLSRDDVYGLVRRHMDRIREQVLHEHEALGAIVQDDKLSQLLAGMPSTDVGTIERMPVPTALIGRSLVEVGFRNLYRAEVLAVQTSEGRFLCPPDPQRPLARSDHLIVLTSVGQARREVTDEAQDSSLDA